MDEFGVLYACARKRCSRQGLEVCADCAARSHLNRDAVELRGRPRGPIATLMLRLGLLVLLAVVLGGGVMLVYSCPSAWLIIGGLLAFVAVVWVVAVFAARNGHIEPSIISAPHIGWQILPGGTPEGSPMSSSDIQVRPEPISSHWPLLCCRTCGHPMRTATPNK